MKFNQLIVQKNKKPSRKGRGISSGKGKTAGRGTKGQGARAGSTKRPGFEGGQTPYIQKMPKLRGLSKGGRTASDKLRRQKTSEIVTTDQINKLSISNIDNFTLYEAGLLRNPHTKVKLILKGEVKKKFVISLQSASKNAIQSIVSKGGVFNKVEQIKRLPKDKKDSTTK